MTIAFRDPLGPAEEDVFSFDWQHLLHGETIVDHVIAPAAPLTRQSSDVSGTTTRAMIRANDAPAGQYAVLFRVTTSGGRSLDETGLITVAPR